LASVDYFYNLSKNGIVAELGNVISNGYSGSFKGLIPANLAALSEQSFGSFGIYPNPSFSLLSIELKEDFYLEVLYVTGKLIQEYRNVKSISIKKSGVYLLRFTVGSQSLIKKVIIEENIHTKTLKKSLQRFFLH
jgi:hypothetical protein